MVNEQTFPILFLDILQIQNGGQSLEDTRGAQPLGKIQSSEGFHSVAAGRPNLII